MKYLLVTCHSYKGGEIGETGIYGSIAECLDNISDDIGDSFEDYMENKREVVQNKSLYAGGDGNCFQIQPMKGYKLQSPLDDEELLAAVELITVADYEATKKRWGIE